MESWRVPPSPNGNAPQQQQYQQHLYSQQHQSPQQQQQQAPYPPRGNPPVDSWRNVARENNGTGNNSSSSSSSRRDRSRSPRERSRRRSPDDRRRRSRSRDRYRRRSPDEREASRGPPKRIFISQLDSDMQHEALTMLFARQGYMPSDVKIVDKRDRGSARSMAFVEFVDASTANKWMEQNKSQLALMKEGRQVPVAAEFVAKTDEECIKKKDWICSRCTQSNYQLRESCFRCNTSKEESDALEAQGFADIDKEKPSDTLLLRNLPEGACEENVMSVLHRVVQGQIPFGRFKLSDSREFAWVQMRNVGDASVLISIFSKSPLMVQGSIVVTTFSRRPLSVILSEPVITERPKIEEPSQQQQQQHNQMPMQPPGYGSGQYGAPPPSMQTMTPAMNPMMPAPGMMSQYGMPPPGMQQQQPHGAAAPPAAVHVDTSHPPPNFMARPPGMDGMMMQQQQQMMGQPPQQQLLQQPSAAMQQAMGMMGQPQQQPPSAAMQQAMGMMGHPQQQPSAAMQQAMGMMGQPQQQQPSAAMQQAMGMMGQPLQQPPPQHSAQQQQLLQAQMAAAAHMGMAMPNMSMPPPMAMQQQQAAPAAAYGMPHMQHMQQQQQPVAADTAMLQAQVAAMAAQLAQQQQAAAAAAAPQQPEKIGHIMTPVGFLKQWDPPNPQTMRPDQSSGYMYDDATNYFYDPKTMYFFSHATQNWNYYDQRFKTYIPVAERDNVTKAVQEGFGRTPILPTTTAGGGGEGAEEKKDEKKTPSEIAKDMMKWAKKQEKEKTKVSLSLKPVVKPLETKSAFGSGIAAAAAAAGQHPTAAAPAADGVTPSFGGFGTEVTLKMLDRSKNPLAHLNSDSDEEDPPMPQGAGGGHHGHHQQQQQQRQPPPAKDEPKVMSSMEHREMMMATLIDRSGKQCLLCRRAFKDVETLDKHVSKSELHVKNLEEKQVEWGKAYVALIMASSNGKEAGDYGSAASTSAPPPSSHSAASAASSWGGGGAAAAPAADSYKYRDRAKERRNIHGIDAIAADPFGNSSRDSGRSQASVDAMMRESDAAAARPIDSSNKGAKMLQAMGWKEGAGLGRNQQGIVAPIQAERRVEGTGLGLSGSKITHGMNASHQDKTRAALFARYQERQ